MTGLCLPFRFDAGLLREDLARVEPEEWAAHYNESDFGGKWQGVALRSGSGSVTDLNAAPGIAGFADTALLGRCPYFREVLAAFRCELKSVRLLSLAPGSFIREHCDNALDFEEGEVRLHIPVQTNADVEFYVSGERLLLEAGSCYYVNVNLPHRVNNRGLEDRVHLVVDAAVDDWVREVFGRSEPVERGTVTAGRVDEFRRLIFRHAKTRERLGAIADRRDFVEAVVYEARERGFDFNEADADAACRTVSDDAPEDTADWIPVKLAVEGGSARAEWIYAAGEEFTDPFFEDSVRRFLRRPLTAFSRCRGPLPPRNSAPKGLIFHMSRCGSTLVSRSLAALARVRVISEAPPIDQAIQAEAPEAERMAWLRGLIGAFGKKPCIVKLDAWHIHNLPLLRAAFPETPWIFVCRDPVEVLASHLRQPGLHMIQGGAGHRVPRVDWGAQVLSGYLRAAIASRHVPGGLFVEYRELPDAVRGSIAAHFGLVLTAAEEAAVRDAALPDAKNPFAPFTPDSAGKQECGATFRENPAVRAMTKLYDEIRGQSVRG